MKTKKTYSGITFYSNDYDVNKVRKTDLFYIAGLAYYGHNYELPDGKQLAHTMKINNITSIEILTDPNNKFQLIAKF